MSTLNHAAVSQAASLAAIARALEVPTKNNADDAPPKNPRNAGRKSTFGEAMDGYNILLSRALADAALEASDNGKNRSEGTRRLMQDGLNFRAELAKLEEKP